LRVVALDVTVVERQYLWENWEFAEFRGDRSRVEVRAIPQKMRHRTQKIFHAIWLK